MVIKEYDSVNLTPDCSQSIKRHIELLSKINHPCVSRNELIEDEDSLKILTEYNGYTIDFLSIIRRYGPQNPYMVREWAIQVCDALQCMHALNLPVLFRALKPSNMFLTSTGQIKFIETVQIQEKGENSDCCQFKEMDYSSPEEYAGHLDERSDIFTFGATFYHFLSGKSLRDTYFKSLEKVNPCLKRSHWVKIINKCCQTDPRRRYQNCNELMKDLIKLPSGIV